jgi:hypothetical protein
MPRRRRVCVVGGGVVGIMTAHYLLELDADVDVTIVESGPEVAGGASGRAGGFLARHWADQTDTGTLSQRGFDLHAELAAQHDGAARYGYRACTAVEASIDLRPEPALQVSAYVVGGGGRDVPICFHKKMAHMCSKKYGQKKTRTTAAAAGGGAVQAVRMVPVRVFSVVSGSLTGPCSQSLGGPGPVAEGSRSWIPNALSTTLRRCTATRGGSRSCSMRG